ncbi:hypothetical protein [Paraburkholderia bryophila]|uniref:Uncharacterized protein n=1 Tax=Paraburkholderia bryophila TaxID=420952 RepID=A0A7Y9W3F5_9BURK|nr:hypothetical protein [Paraburkholderia bryophila]NYH13570.1 hypothetical protein [Paraburkholderia bryophila]
MEQHKTVILRLTEQEFERLNAERLGLVLLPVELKISNPAYVPPGQKQLYRGTATPSVIGSIEDRYEIVDIR